MSINDYQCELSADERHIEIPGVDLGIPTVPSKGYPVHAVLHRNPTVVVIHVKGHKTWNGNGRPWRWEPAYFALYELTANETMAVWKGQFLATPDAMKRERGQ